MKRPDNMTIGGVIFGTVGLVLLWSVDWRLAVGIFLTLWGNNMQRR